MLEWSLIAVTNCGDGSLNYTSDKNLVGFWIVVKFVWSITPQGLNIWVNFQWITKTTRSGIEGGKITDYSHKLESSFPKVEVKEIKCTTTVIRLKLKIRKCANSHFLCFHTYNRMKRSESRTRRPIACLLYTALLQIQCHHNFEPRGKEQQQGNRANPWIQKVNILTAVFPRTLHHFQHQKWW